MSGFLQRLADRSTGSDGAMVLLAPRRPSIFEPEGGPGLGLGPGGLSSMNPTEADGAVGLDAGEQGGRIGSARLAPREARGRVDGGVTSPPVVALADEVAPTTPPAAAGWPARLRASLAPESLQAPSRSTVDSTSFAPPVPDMPRTPANLPPSGDLQAVRTGRRHRAFVEASRGGIAPPLPLAPPPRPMESPLARVSTVDDLFAGPAGLDGPSRRVTTGTLRGTPLVDVPSGSAASAPVVHVTIGRIEVRAMPEKKKAKPLSGRRPAAPRLSLDDYQRRRREGER